MDDMPMIWEDADMRGVYRRLSLQWKIDYYMVPATGYFRVFYTGEIGASQGVDFHAESVAPSSIYI